MELGWENYFNYKKINCPSLASFSYRPLFNGQHHFGDGYTWNFPLLKKLKLNRCGSFIRNLKHLEVLIVLNFWRADRQLLKELPRLKYLDVQRIDDGESFGSLDEEFGDRVQINYRALPLRYARNRIKAIQKIRDSDIDEFWSFGMEDLELYEGCFEQVAEEIHFYHSFTVSDYCRELGKSFFGKFVDVTDVNLYKHTLSQEELNRIIDSFPNVKKINGVIIQTPFEM